jgi:hypothetical protein
MTAPAQPAIASAQHREGKQRGRNGVMWGCRLPRKKERNDYTTFTTLPERRQRVQILMVVFVLPIIVWILRRLGFHTLRVLFFAWLTLFPVTVPFPHMSHLRAIDCLP